MICFYNKNMTGIGLEPRTHQHPCYIGMSRKNSIFFFTKRHPNLLKLEFYDTYLPYIIKHYAIQY